MSSRPATRPQARAGRLADEAQIEQIRQGLGLDKPIYEQYWIYMRDLVLHFDFGYSYQSNVAGAGADLRPPAGDDLAGRSGRRSSGC